MDNPSTGVHSRDHSSVTPASVTPVVSAISWTAIIAGALTASVLTVVLVLLGSGIGLASVSPWTNVGATAGAFTAATAIWLIVMQWISSAFGGFVTGRLRTRWHSLHTHEVFFRDTAHGLLTWALATLVVATVLGSAVASSVSGGTHAAAAVAAGAAAGKAGSPGQDTSTLDPLAYYIDNLYRTSGHGTGAADHDVRGETSRIFLTDLKEDQFPGEDRAYLIQLVSAKTGIGQGDAGTRVDNAIKLAEQDKQKAKEAADAARKAAASLAIFTALSMLVGAFVACVAAAIGGIERDKY